MGEIAVRRRYKSTVERVAVDKKGSLRTGDGKREPMPRSVRQPEREGLHTCRRTARGHVMQSYLIAPPARLHFQIPERTASPVHHLLKLTSYTCRLVICITCSKHIRAWRKKWFCYRHREKCLNDTFDTLGIVLVYVKHKQFTPFRGTQIKKANNT